MLESFLRRFDLNICTSAEFTVTMFTAASASTPVNHLSIFQYIFSLHVIAGDPFTLVVGIICKGALHGAYIITPAFLPDLRAFQSPKSTFQPSPWSLKRCKTGSVSALLASTWVTGHDKVMETLVAYVTEQTATTTPTQAPLLVHFAPTMAGDHQTREILRLRFGDHHVGDSYI